MQRNRFFTALAVLLMAALPVAAQTQKPGDRRVSALPVIEGDPDPTPADRITIQMLRQKMADGEQILIIDARSEGSWEEGETQIKGAVRIHPDEVEQAVKSGLLKSMSRTMLIAAYCT